MVCIYDVFSIVQLQKVHQAHVLILLLMLKEVGYQYRHLEYLM